MSLNGEYLWVLKYQNTEQLEPNKAKGRTGIRERERKIKRKRGEE